MKAEEKQELQQNDLETFLYYRLPHYLKEYGSYILLGAALIFLAYRLWQNYEQRKQTKLQNAWVSLDEASSRDVMNPVGKLRETINQYDVRAVQAQAWVRLGKFYQETVLAGNPPAGVRDVKVTREQALEEGQKAFETVLRDFGDQSVAVAAAHFGLAAIAEDRGEWDKAKKEYEWFMDAKSPYAGTAFAGEAERKLKRMEEIKGQVSWGPRMLPAKAEDMIERLAKEAATQKGDEKPTSAPATTLPQSHEDKK